MTRFSKYSAGLLAATVLYVAPAHAQATRTWISGVGDDVNPCSRTAPCKTFAGAIPKTAPGGEINCLDPGGFGAVTITKSISLICDTTEAGILVSSGNAININDGGAGTAQVTLSGLDFEGLGFSTAGSGARGVSFISGASLVVRNSSIRNFRDGSNGTGISFTPSGAATLLVENVTITGNGNTGVGGGIRIQPTGTGSARVALRNVRIGNNTNAGLTIDSTGNTGPGITATLDNVEVAGNGSGAGIALSAPAGTTTIGVMIRNSSIANNATGIVANGATMTGRVSNTAITGNNLGLLVVGGATLASYGNNQLDGNPTVGAPNNGAFTGAPLPPH